MHSLLKNCAIDYADALVTAASNTDNNSSIFDMAGYDGICFITTITDSVQDGVATLKIEENSANSDSGMTAISGATVSATSAANDDLNGMLLIVDCYRPQERYVQAVRVSATQNIAFGEVIAIRYKGREVPVTQSSTLVAGSAFAVGS
jgi:hypothetical protein